MTEIWERKEFANLCYTTGTLINVKISITNVHEAHDKYLYRNLVSLDKTCVKINEKKKIHS